MNFADQLYELVKDAHAKGVALDEVINGLAQGLHAAVHADAAHAEDRPALDDDKVLIVKMTPFACGCLCIEVQAGEPLQESACHVN